MKKYNICYNCGKRKPTIKFPDYGFHIGLTCSKCEQGFSFDISYYVYVLRNPIDKQVFYVGRTNDIARRLRQHWNLNYTNRYLAYKMRELKNQNQKPEMICVATSDYEGSKELERIWIVIGRSLQWPLRNMSNHGDYFLPGIIETFTPYIYR